MVDVYRPEMSLLLNNDIPVTPLFLKPEITVWYSRIPDILRSVCCKGTYHNFKQMVNEIFQKSDFAPGFLNEGEIEQLNRFKALKKQVEWLCGRYLVKALLHHEFLTEIPLDAICLDYMDEGAPFVVNFPDIPVSISHSNDFTVAAAADRPDIGFGIDIEKIAKKPDRYFLKTAFTQKEISNLPDSAEQIFKAWTIKEAFMKYIKKGFHESLHKIEVIDETVFHNGVQMDLDIASVSFDGYVISLVSGK